MKLVSKRTSLVYGLRKDIQRYVTCLHNKTDTVWHKSQFGETWKFVVQDPQGSLCNCIMIICKHDMTYMHFCIISTIRPRNLMFCHRLYIYLPLLTLQWCTTATKSSICKTSKWSACYIVYMYLLLRCFTSRMFQMLARIFLQEPDAFVLINYVKPPKIENFISFTCIYHGTWMNMNYVLQ